MSRMLASVASVDEADVALGIHADIIDCKNPHDGALGALPPETILHIVRNVDGRRQTSATVGDDIHQPGRLRDAVRTVSDCGVDYIKFGLFDEQAAGALIKGLSAIAHEYDLIAVCFADRYDPTAWLEVLHDVGVRGIMVDTADKHAGSLTSLWSQRQIAEFVRRTHGYGLLCGLAGRLRATDIPDLLPAGADYLGFRSALCLEDRRGRIDHGASMLVREAMPFLSGTSVIRPDGVALH